MIIHWKAIFAFVQKNYHSIKHIVTSLKVITCNCDFFFIKLSVVFNLYLEITFVLFYLINIKLFLKSFPCLVPLQDAAKVCRGFMEREQGEVRFSAVALCHSQTCGINSSKHCKRNQQSPTMTCAHTVHLQTLSTCCFHTLHSHPMNKAFFMTSTLNQSKI